MAQTPITGVDRCIARWQSTDGSERANYQLFVHELCTLLELPTPDPAREDTRDNAYVSSAASHSGMVRTVAENSPTHRHQC